MKREHVISRGNPFALPCIASSSKRFETDCALNRLQSRLCVTTLPKKRRFSVDSYGEKCVFNARSEAGKTLLIVREDQGTTACASPEESNEKRRVYLPIELCLQSEKTSSISGWGLLRVHCCCCFFQSCNACDFPGTSWQWRHRGSYDSDAPTKMIGSL